MNRIDTMIRVSAMVLVLTVTGLFVAMAVGAEVPQVINYQGKLTDDTRAAFTGDGLEMSGTGLREDTSILATKNHAEASADLAASPVDEMEIFGDQIVPGNIVQEQNRSHLETLNIKAVPADTCLNIIVRKTAWVRNEKIKVTMTNPAWPYTVRDSIRTGGTWTIITKIKDIINGPNSAAEWVDTMVARINASAAADRVTAEDSGTYFILRSDSNYQRMDIRTDASQTVDTISANDMYAAMNPSVIFAPQGETDSLWLYIMGMTGLVPGSPNYESPQVRVSHDNITWVLPIVGTDTCPDPIFWNTMCTSYTHQEDCADTYGWDSGGVASHLSDAHLRYWTDGNYYFYARATFYYSDACGNEPEDAIFVSKSTNLVSWTDPLLVAGPDSLTDFISPSSELHKADTLYFWATHQGPIAHDSTNRLMLYKTEHPESTWVFVDTCIVYPYFGGITDSADSVWARTHGIWHTQVRKGEGPDQYEILNGDQGHGLFIGLSDDGLNFRMRKDPLIPDYTDGSGHEHTVYTGTSVKIHSGKQVGRGIWYSHFYDDDWICWQTSYTETFFDDTLFYEPINFKPVFYDNDAPDSCTVWDH